MLVQISLLSNALRLPQYATNGYSGRKPGTPITGWTIVLFISMLFMIDYISVINIKQAPRFSIIKISSDTAIYYDTLFYDVIRCNKNSKDEYYKIIKNNNYDKDNIQKYCKKISSK